MTAFTEAERLAQIIAVGNSEQSRHSDLRLLVDALARAERRLFLVGRLVDFLDTAETLSPGMDLPAKTTAENFRWALSAPLPTDRHAHTEHECICGGHD